LENVGFVVSKALGSRPGEPVSILAVFDCLVVAGVVAVAVAVAGGARHHRSRG
jgi:hypothetical protein